MATPNFFPVKILCFKVMTLGSWGISVPALSVSGGGASSLPFGRSANSLPFFTESTSDFIQEVDCFTAQSVGRYRKYLRLGC